MKYAPDSYIKKHVCKYFHAGHHNNQTLSSSICSVTYYLPNYVLLYVRLSSGGDHQSASTGLLSLFL